MKETQRIYFLDALRTFAILMMLQGHFVSGVLDSVYKNSESSLYTFWLYCRGFTAPVFFTVTGWVVTFLLLKNPTQGMKNPRIKKGLKRGAELIAWGYLLRLNLPSLFYGELNTSFLKPDVLQIIGLGLIFIVGIYSLCHYLKLGLGIIFLVIGVTIFILDPLYAKLVFEELPIFLAAYLTKANGGVFYLFPWIGYVCIGAFIAYVFGGKSHNLKYKNIGFAILGMLLIFKSSPFFIWIYDQTGWTIFRQVAYNNFLFIRLGDVLVLISFFMTLNTFFSKQFWVWIGQKTLTIYIVHYFIFYGSLFGIGVYKYYKHSWTPIETVFGALIFILLSLLITLLIHKYRSKVFLAVKEKLSVRD